MTPTVAVLGVRPWRWIELRFYRASRGVGCSRAMKDPSAQQPETSAAVHRPLQHLEAANLTLDGARGPRPCERRVHCIEVAAEPGSEVCEHGAVGSRENFVEISSQLAPEDGVQPLCPIDGGAERGRLFEQSLSEEPILRNEP